MKLSNHVKESLETRGLTPCLRMSGFQKMMLEWDGIHPYNAVHAVALTGRADILALQNAVHRVCAATGIGELVVDREHQSYHYRPVADIQIRHIPDGPGAEQTLHTIIREEMNKPFPAQPHFPLRWIVFDDTSNDSHFLILVYH